MDDPIKRMAIEDCRSRIKATIRQLESTIGINETVPVNTLLVRALGELESMERS